MSEHENSLTERITIRAPAGLWDRMAVAADTFGGTPSERIRLACYLHDCMGTLHWLGMPQAAEELGNDLEAAREEGQEDLKRVTAGRVRRETHHLLTRTEK